MENNSNNLADNNNKSMSESIPKAVWLAEAQSSQRDMLAGLQTLKSKYPSSFTVIASHRKNRPEIFEFADTIYREPHSQATFADVAPSEISDAIATPRWQFVLEHARQNNVKVLLTGRNSKAYEAQREQFSAAGIRLLTGATDVDTLSMIDDKFAFMQYCHTHNIPVVQSWRFDTIDELTTLLAEHDHQPLCVKPVTGIFAQGFWRLDTGTDENGNTDYWDSFEHLYFTEDKKISTTQFLAAYRNSQMLKEQPIPMLLMPFLSGQEFSIDVVCEYGEVLAAVTRHKTGKVQHIGYDESVMAVVIPLIKACGCDGIVSVQTKADDNGQHCVLEINSRPSGGIGYTSHSGVDLTQVGFGYWLKLTDKPNVDEIAAQIVPCQVRSIMMSVKIENDNADTAQ